MGYFHSHNMMPLVGGNPFTRTGSAGLATGISLNMEVFQCSDTEKKVSVVQIRSCPDRGCSAAFSRYVFEIRERESHIYLTH